MSKTLPSIYEIRNIGKDYCCKTEGSDHYKGNVIEPAEYAIQK